MILLAPFYGFERTKGCAQTPAKIISLLDKIPLNEAGFNIKHEIISAENIQEMQKKISEYNGKTIIIGGDHTITLPAVRGFVQKNPSAGIVIFDAHPDAVSKFHPLQKDLMIGLVQERLIPPNKIILVGVRSWTGEEKEFLDSNNIRYFTMKKMMIEGRDIICDAVMETANSWPSFYLSIDMDVVDPVFVPAVETPVPGGFSSRELIYFIQRLSLLKNLKCADICEIDAEKDSSGVSCLLGAKIVNELK